MSGAAGKQAHVVVVAEFYNSSQLSVRSAFSCMDVRLKCIQHFDTIQIIPPHVPVTYLIWHFPPSVPAVSNS